ncbi:RNA-directed RNA polymerase, variant [Blastomyces dermatitidis ER-3]|uniref:RNA-dependent RNA polymerase n=1 Tax=Ajellomyces dermatitidis (strain ER-3 / ATCC MYA-2586) TaxID=559297 RepID=A0ABX2VXK5_AJEDR|nr:RNA-directed RNA polymerase [Blastomyces dermatitidis ER-3]XP_045281606.1 RNA-directed RNA polymerase, variant [Blastomyces dermatitidis ER-3]OAT01878.1 RNA-directed RNA polymerase [Blastomyces dermatitidis ER-3]OAT01879.1 RNA-directed RNA polymerase, variant [Blastomyces dermatitidis ER-3]
MKMEAPNHVVAATATSIPHVKKRPRRSRGRGDPRNARMREEAAYEKQMKQKKREAEEKLKQQQQQQQQQQTVQALSRRGRRRHHLIPAKSRIQITRPEVLSTNPPPLLTQLQTPLCPFSSSSSPSSPSCHPPLHLPSSSQQSLLSPHLVAATAAVSERPQLPGCPGVDVYGCCPPGQDPSNAHLEMAQRPEPLSDSRPGRRAGLNVSSPSTRFTGRDTDSRNTSPIKGEWASWESVTLSLTRIPKNANTFTLFKSFSAYGNIDYIEIYKGNREGQGKIQFKPPPRDDFWNNRRYKLALENNESVLLGINLETQRRILEIASPTRPGVKYPATIELHALSVDFGSMIEERSFLRLRSLPSNRIGTVRLVLNVEHRELCIFVNVPKVSANLSENTENSRPGNPFRFCIRFSQLTNIFQIRSLEQASLVIPLDSPAICHQQITALEKEHFPENENVWSSRDTWFRQTDIVRYPEIITRTPVNLRKQNSYINFGRWTTFRLAFHENTLRDDNKFQNFNNALKDFNVNILETDDIKVIERAEPISTVWKWIDAPSTHRSRPRSSLEDLGEDEYIPLPFSVRYQLEVCMSHRYINEYTIEETFVRRLVQLGEKKAKELLEHVAMNKTIYYDPMEIFNIPFPKGATNGRIPGHCCYIRSADVTPSTICYDIPSVDTSNRVFRYHREHADRFLRVRFCDEKYIGKIYPNNSGNSQCMEKVYARVLRTLQHGITIGDRRYEFLAFGNSQLREHGAYFFASLPHLTAANIRAQMGDLNNIRVVAKYAARLGQCFSTTRAVTSCPVQIKKIDDIERNGYVFSDGVGRLSHFLTQMIQSDLGIKTPSGEPPSVFQFRLGGCKGILAVSPEARQREVHIRRSQFKFPASHNGLEIIRYSHFSYATLNRQLILILSALGTPDEVFIAKLSMMLANLEQAMTDEDKAVSLLQKYVDPNQMTLVLADMIRDGFQGSREPFVSSLLELWRTWQIKYLKEKAKIAIDEGAFLLGCIDETKTLKGYFRSARPKANSTYQERVDCLPEIFVQVWRHSEGKYAVIEGLCILARNPSLHPGDIRVVKAIQFLSPEERPQFDKRILKSGIEVDEKLLSVATDLKMQYDTDMRRIMARHEIETELEVWSTFVLSHSEMSNDYKFHEDIGRISSALREKFSTLCQEKAGGNDFEHLAPLAVAMYKVTSEQMEAAMAEKSAVLIENNKMEKRLPLISFPWVLQQVLGKIANGCFESPLNHRRCPAIIQVEIPRAPKPIKAINILVSPDAETEGGLKYAGDVLQLFDDSESKEELFEYLSEQSDKPEAPAGQDEGIITPSFQKIHGPNGEGADLLIAFNDDTSTPSISLPYPNIQGKITIPAREPLTPNIAPPARALDLNGIEFRSVSQAYFANSYLPATQCEANGLQVGDANRQRTKQNAKPAWSLAVAVGSQEDKGEEEGHREEIIEFGHDIQTSALDELEQLLGMN